MIEQSFIFLEGVGLKREKQLWNQGITDWEEYLQSTHRSLQSGKTMKSIRMKGISPKTKIKHSLQIKRAQRALQDYDFSFFQKQLNQNQHWRLFDQVQDDIVYLDIETSGYYGDITVIGMYDGKDVMTMVRGKNLDKNLLQKTLAKYTALVTFNGSSFDLPVIKRYFNIDFSKHLHIDLRHVCSKIDLRGGLKKIERDLGIRRADEVLGVTGEDAVYLWQQYRATGNEKYLRLLVQYNEEDIVNLQPLAKKVIPKVWKNVKG